MHIAVAHVSQFKFVLFREMSWRFSGELLEERLQFGCRRCARNAWPDLDHRPVFHRLRRGEVKRQVDVAIQPGKAQRQHAQDGVGLMKKLNGFADDRWIAVKVALPELVAQDNDLLRLLAVRGIGRKKIAAKHGRQTEELKAIAGQINSLHIFGNIAASDGQAPSGNAHYVFDSMRLAQLPYLRTCEAVPAFLGSCFIQEKNL